MNITPPQGQEIDYDNSTIVFKDIKKSTRWEDLKSIEGYHVDEDSEVRGEFTWRTEDEVRNVYATEQQALASLAQAQLTQIVKNVNGDWVADWDDFEQIKFIIQLYNNKYDVVLTHRYNYLLAFPTKKIALAVLDQNKELFNDYMGLYS